MYVSVFSSDRSFDGWTPRVVCNEICHLRRTTLLCRSPALVHTNAQVLQPPYTLARVFVYICSVARSLAATVHRRSIQKHFRAAFRLVREPAGCTGHVGRPRDILDGMPDDRK